MGQSKTSVGKVLWRHGLTLRRLEAGTEGTGERELKLDGELA